MCLCNMFVLGFAWKLREGDHEGGLILSNDNDGLDGNEENW